MNTPTILIADDHVIIRRGMKFLIDTHFGKFNIQETETTRGLMQLVKEHAFTHLILDMQLQDGNVLEVLDQLNKKYPSVLILIYTMSPEEIFGKRVLQLGARGFISKQSSEKEVLFALSLFFAGKKYISQKLHDSLMNTNSEKSESENPIESLSDREAIVLNYLLKGEGVKEIALRLEVKSNTVATFKARLFDKLGVSNLIDLRNLADIYNFKSS
ncbi:MAG: response regulator transcription factor [Bacteroidia bacterium]